MTNPTREDLSFLANLEETTLPDSEFGHAGHVRAAWICFVQDDRDTAKSRFTAALKRYAASLGAADKYHATVTDTLLDLIYARMAEGPEGESWGAFARRNEDLIANAQGVLDRHYSRERLFSDQARRTLMPPDREPLPGLPQPVE